MPRTQSEDDKKHGDKLEPLIERTGGSSSPRKPEPSADDDDPALPDDDDPALLQDDDDEDIQNDIDSHRDVDE